jgi:hypothetical protein
MPQPRVTPRLVTLVLPVEAGRASSGELAPGLAGFAGARLGIVDNELWRAMRVFGEVWRDHVGVHGASGVETTPFDHLAPDFGDQQLALGPFGRRVRGVVTGLGN